MADYIYLLQNRLSAAQQAALQTIRDVSRAHGLTVFLVGGAVRDLTSGSPVRDLDVVVQGNALKLKKELELAGASIAGEVASWQTLFALFPGGVRVEIGSTLSVTYPKPAKPVAIAATILDDLRRRDFTANAMALSLNEGSYGLLMDPLNGVADIENRQLRLVSNYGFIEDPVRMIRAARFAVRLGWTMDEKTQARYETGKAEKYIAGLSNVHRGYEAEQIFHEEDPLRVLRKLEEEGWMKHLFPAMTVAKANGAELDRLREVQTQLQVSGINPDPAAANFPLLTAKLTPTEIAELKKSFIRQGFVREIESLEAEAKEFAAQLSGKGATLPSQAWKLIHAAKPEAVLWVSYSSKSPAVQAKLKSFHTEWPKARQKVPFALMQEMRIVPELESFNEVVENVFFELMDGNLATPEEQKAFLEPFSPPAPPPPVRLGRSRAGKKDGKAAKGKKKIAAFAEDEEEDPDLDRDLQDAGDSRDEDHDDHAADASDANEDAVSDLPIAEVDDDDEADEDSQSEIEAPLASNSLPVAAPLAEETLKPKRMKTPAKATEETATTVEETPVPMLSDHSSKVKAAPQAVKAAKAKPAVKAIAVPVAKVAKPMAKAAKTPAKKAISPDKAPHGGQATAPVTKAVVEKQTAVTKKSAPDHLEVPVKVSARKVTSTPEETAAKRKR